MAKRKRHTPEQVIRELGEATAKPASALLGVDGSVGLPLDIIVTMRLVSNTIRIGFVGGLLLKRWFSTWIVGDLAEIAESALHLFASLARLVAKQREVRPRLRRSRTGFARSLLCDRIGHVTASDREKVGGVILTPCRHQLSGVVP
jgi:hypothetical protein